jgi:hypothetical protein
VVATGRNLEGQCNVTGWTGIVQVTADGYHTVGLKADGTVVATGDNTYGQCNVTGWRLGSPALGPPSEGMFYLIPSKRGSAAVIYLE